MLVSCLNSGTRAKIECIDSYSTEEQGNNKNVPCFFIKAELF